MRTVPDASTASGIRGYWFVFNEEGHTFAHWVGPVTGKEEVFLDNRLVSESRRFTLNSSHSVETPHATYTLILRSISVKSSAIECTLLRNGVPVARAVARYESNVPRAMRIATIATVAGVLYAQYKSIVSPAISAVVLCSVVATSVAVTLSRGRYTIGPAPLQAQTEA
jgi:hypothetical protein